MAILDRKMAALKAEIAQQAAVAAQKHKFNQGSAHPTGDASPRRLASGLAATAQVRFLPPITLLPVQAEKAARSGALNNVHGVC